jgi:T4-like virus Myoviridae tail sheath stabiliser
LFGHSWYFSTIRKYVILFGTIFNDIRITRTDADGNVVDLFKVPLAYAAKEKMIARFESDPNIDRPYSVILPRMSFEMVTMDYDGNRKLPTTNRYAVKDTDANYLQYQYTPVPYNIHFRLYVYVKNAEDGTKIIEQILPFFTPDWTASVRLIPEMNITMDIPVILNNINIDDIYDGTFETRRVLVWTLDFTCKGYIYGPIKKQPVIKFANTTFYIASVPDGELRSAVGNTDPSSRVTVRPGLTADGKPTSNGALSVPYADIEADDDFGYVVVINEDEDLPE